MFPYFALGVLIASAAPTEPLKVAILEMKLEGGLDPVIGTQLTAKIAEAAARARCTVIAPDDLRAMLEQQAQKQLLGCADDQCIAEIAGALGVDALLSGRVGKVDGGFAVSLSLIDASDSSALGRAVETWRGESIGLLELMTPMVDQVLAPKGSKLVGTLEIEGAASGSRILIDDQIRGTAPAGQMSEIAIGARKVQVIEDGYEPFERWVVVKKDARTTVGVQQVARGDQAVYTKWWFWTAAAAGVAGAAVGTALLISGGDGDGGATGVNVSVNTDTALSGGR